MPDGDITDRIAHRVRELRAAGGLSLDALGGRSGVSRSMISLIERAQTSPTAVVLEKLAAGLGVNLSDLFNAAPAHADEPHPPLSRREEQPEWQDPASGYVRRNVSPPHVPQPMHIVDVHFPPGARVAFDQHVRDTRIHQQIWILAGTMEITLGRECHRLREGDCLAMQLDRPIVFHNPSRKPARYAVVLANKSTGRR